MKEIIRHNGSSDERFDHKKNEGHPRKKQEIKKSEKRTYNRERDGAKLQTENLLLKLSY